jgi:hypothetical protein
MDQEAETKNRAGNPTMTPRQPSRVALGVLALCFAL